MKKIDWINTTKKHPQGVCEAATSIWLQRIAQLGIEKADKITPEECDDLQSKVEAGTYTWAADLLELLGPGATFDAFTNPGDDSKALLQGMQDQDFYYISATSTFSGHAVAVVKVAGKYYFFDPNYAIYIYDSSEIDELVAQIATNLRPWRDIAFRKGTLSDV